VDLDAAGGGSVYALVVGLAVALVLAVLLASGLAVDVVAVETVAMGLDVQGLDDAQLFAVEVVAMASSSPCSPSTLAAGDGSALAVGLDMAGDGIAVDAELGLDVRLVPAVPLASGLAVDVAAVETVARGLDVQGLDGGQLPAVEVVTVASSSPCSRRRLVPRQAGREG
jgi:hypothetical protein